MTSAVLSFVMIWVTFTDIYTGNGYTFVVVSKRNHIQAKSDS